MEVLKRIDEIHRMLAPMVVLKLITPEQEEDIKRGIMNLRASFAAETRPGSMHHHDYYTHEVLVGALFNWCSDEARAYALGLPIESVTYDDDQPTAEGGENVP